MRPSLAATTALLSAALLVGCGGTAATPSSSTAPAAAQPSRSGQANQADVSALPDGVGAVTANPDGTRTVQSSWGTVVVPAKPQRIVSVLGDTDVDAMVALGIPLVGAGTQGGGATDGFAPHVASALANTTPLAWGSGLPIEDIAALKPDLIFTVNKETADQLQKIAPTVPRGSALGERWKDDFRYVAAVLGQDQKARELLGAYERRATALAAELAPVVKGRTVASPQVSSDAANVQVDYRGAFSSAVLTELGLPLHPMVTAATEENAQVSFERLTDINADILFWQVRQDDKGQPDHKALEKVTKSPLWARLPAVQAGQVHQVANRPWYFAGLLSAQRVLDDVEKALL
ncbi:ABC transporter substrate-binding protein [Planomonospora sp. ID67723]|uniref:ABC transporter substrate-binding protein n=1 Tax=Planomonospora sp. ID67723 TaxID=2738134 RepID=UPI0018C3A3D5|nr:ABC transporter substrate-binding protein [Planomonospora sp. ID67723]MBG0829778.1 ABC transporter substrate-binding protein [Planomonospora sp. ID67723]